MADYTIRVEADTRESQKKVDDLDKRLNEVEKPRKIDIHIPSLQETVNGVKTLGDALKTAFNAARMIPGNPINDLEQVGDILGQQARKVADAAALITKATPTNILGNSFNVASEGAVALSKNVASLGYTVFGVTQSVNILKSAFGGFFDETIGREIKLQETLLRTKTTLVSTADVAVNGKRLTDPYEAILKLEKPIEKTVNNIRMRSLDIAGTTSDAIIQTFGVVASQIGQVGGSIKDAEDLAISFAGALGTLGLSDPMYATQEIRSILTGNIDQNSILARSLGLTNEDVAKAKKSADGLVVYLQKRLEAFTAGQSIAAKGFAGITSNIQEVQQELSRVFGKPFLQPMLDGLTKVYERLQLVTASLKKTREGNPLPGPAVGIADALGRTGNAVVTGVAGAALQAPSLTKLTQRAQYEGFERLEKVLADVFLKIQAAIDKMRPQITLLAEEAIRAGTEIVKGLGALAAGFAQFKFENFKYMMAGWIGFAQLLNDTVVPAVRSLLQIYGALLSNEDFQRLSQFVAQWQVLEKAGILPAVRGIQSLYSAISSLWPLLSGIPKAIDAIGNGIKFVIDKIAVGIAGLTAFIARSGAGILQLFVLLAQTLYQGARLIASTIGVALINLAEAIQRLYPKFGELAIMVAGVGRAFLNLDISVKKAQISLTKFALDASEQLAKIELNAAQVKARLDQIGTGLQNGLKGAGNAVMGLIGNIAKFFAWQLILQVAITSLFDFMQKFNEQQQNIADKTRAELAVRRLSTAYKDLGDNATLAAKKAKEFEDAIVSNRLSEVTKKIEELSNKIREFEAKSAASKRDSPIDRVRRSLFDFSTWKTSKELESVMTAKEKADLKAGKQPDTNMLAARAELQRLNAERKKLAQEAQTLLKYQEKADADKQSKEQVDILGKERKQLEKELADYRKQLNKEITDNEFNFRQERLQIEQTAREAQRASESAALGRSIEQNLAGLSGFRRQFAEILDNYQKRLFDAQTESQKRQFDLARQRERLEKNLNDYKLKLEEQITKLRMKTADYSAKITKWESDEKIKAARLVLEYAMRAGTAAAGRLTLMPEDRERFQNAATKKGLSPEKLLAYVMATQTTSTIPSLSGADMSAIIDAIIDTVNPNAKDIFKVGRNDEQAFIKGLNISTKRLYNQETGGTYAFSEAGRILNSSNWKKLAPSAPPKTFTGLSDIESENRRAISSYEQNQNAILENTRALYALQDRLKAQENMSLLNGDIEKAFKEGMRTPAIIQEDLEVLRSKIDIQRQSLASGARFIDPFQQKNAENERRLTVALNTVFNKFKGQGFNKSIEDLISSYQQYKDTNQYIDQKTGSFQNQTAAFIVNSAMARYRNDRDTRQAELGLIATAEIDKLTTAITNLRPTFEEASLNLIQKVQEALLPSDAIQRRQFEADKQIEAIRRTPEYAQVSGNPEYMATLKHFAELVQLSATKLGQLDKAVEAFVTKLALIKDTAATLTEGFKTSFKNLLNGQITGFDEMMNSIREKFTNAFADWIFKPIQDSIEKELKRWFNVDNEAQKLADLQKQYTEEFKTAVANFGKAVDTFSGKPSPEEPAPGTPAPGTAPSPEPAPAPGTSPTSGPVRLAVVPGADNIALSPSTVGAATTASANFNTLSTSLSNLSETAKKTPSAIQQTTSNLQNFLGGMATVAAGIAGIVAGIQQLGSKKGGAAGTLMGLSNIFIGLGTTLIGGGKLFKAAGGPVSAGSPYIVGEKGPEWFVPSRSGNILPNGTGPGGGGSPVNSVVNVHISDAGTRTDNNQASQLGRMIDSAVVNILNRERRPGGLLTAR